jgi:hypothetical protein
VVVVVHHDLERDVELLRVVQGRLVVERDAPRAVVDVQAVVEAARLRLAAQLLQCEALARRLAASAREGPRFQHLDLVAELAQFIRRRHAGQARAEDDDLLAPAAAGQCRRGIDLGRDPDAPGVHRIEQQGRTANHCRPVEKFAPRQRPCQTFHPHLFWLLQEPSSFT